MMDDNIVLEVESLSKKFCQRLKYSMYYGTIDIMRSMLGIKYNTSELRKAEFWALDNVNFVLRKGETLGIIGLNGSGKSTLLRLISGIYPPDKGRISIKGRIGALIAVGAGFHPHMTGRENIYLNGTILGMTRKEINKKLNKIIDFADIGDFLDAPVSVYSSGMTIRLGFSIAIHSEPEILLIDEILAVGDVGFQLKCFNKLGELKKKNTAIILISHNLHHMSTFSNNLLVLDKGKVVHYGEVPMGLSIYKLNISALKTLGEIERVSNGNEDFKVKEVKFSPTLNNEIITISSNSDLSFCIEYDALKDFKNSEIDVILRLPIPSPTDFFQTTNYAQGSKLDIFKGEGSIQGTIKNINLNNITAYLFIALWAENRKSLLFWWRNIPCKIISNDSLSQGWINYEVDFNNKSN